MGIDFVSGAKYTNFWLHIGLRVYFDLYAPDFPKKYSKYFEKLSTFIGPLDSTSMRVTPGHQFGQIKISPYFRDIFFDKL